MIHRQEVSKCCWKKWHQSTCSVQGCHTPLICKNNLCKEQYSKVQSNVASLCRSQRLVICPCACLQIMWLHMHVYTHRKFCCCLVAQLCPTVCHPMDCSPPGFSVHEILVDSGELSRWLSGKESTCQCRRQWVQSLGREDPLEEGMATHSSILAWRIPWTVETGGLQCKGSQRVPKTRLND